ncbi:MAG: hypothetical protein HKN46_09410 [Acidimicrobiia bacterium]|nr:hypothetical protein [Acidimicrobiia bacterium]
MQLVTDCYDADRLLVARDDLIPGGTKARALPAYLDAIDAAGEVVYAGPVYGYAQIAVAYAAAATGRRATVFVAARKKPHSRTLEAKTAGAKVVQVRPGYLSNVEAKARGYCELVGATALPFGLDDPVFSQLLAKSVIDAGARHYSPDVVWCAAGSGTLSRTLATVWPTATINAVAVGKHVEASGGIDEVYSAPEKFEADARKPPPFPSCSNYDAKVWRFVTGRSNPHLTHLFWNVAA